MDVDGRGGYRQPERHVRNQGTARRATFLGLETVRRKYWADMTGNFWLFGGHGLRLNGEAGRPQRPVGVRRRPMGVDERVERVNQNGKYGIQGTAAPSNFPGARISR